MKLEKPNWTYFFIFTLISTLIALSPILVCAYINYTNLNNVAYNSNEEVKHFGKIILSSLSFLALIHLPFLFFNKRIRIIYFACLIILLYLPSAFDFLHTLLFSARANASSYFALFSTNSNEAYEFVLDYSSEKLFLGLFCFVTIPFLLYYIHQRFIGIRIKKILTATTLIASVFVCLVDLLRVKESIYDELSSVKLYKAYFSYKKENADFVKLIANVKPLKVKHTVLDENETHIIIIGESTSKFHMQLYGYNRQTTPELVKLKNELSVFHNIKSSHVHTISSIKDAFMLRDSLNNYSPYSIIDCFSAAGYSTYWISNQQFFGRNQTLVTGISNRASHKTFICPSGEAKPDGALIQEIIKVLKSGKNKKVIFVHLMGTHLRYQDRYPISFQKFKSKNISIFGEHADAFINHYDNAILYNDKIVSSIISLVKKKNGLNSVLYFSDHGDEVYDFRDFHGHSEPILSKYMNSIPFILYANEAFAKLKKTKIVSGKQNQFQSFSLKDFPYTVQDLYDIKSPYYYSKKSFFHTDTVIKNYALKKDSAKLIVQKAFPLFNEKIWVHRVNSLERLAEVQGLFRGMELDIVYENGKFDVRHPPVESCGLSLDDFFKHVKNIKTHYFWLDFHNLKSNNQKEIIEKLILLLNKYGIKKNVIVETKFPELLHNFEAAGLTSSYYFSNIAKLQYDKMEMEIEKVRRNIENYNPQALSQSIDNYILMKDNFRNSNKLIWALQLVWNEKQNQKRILDLLRKDPSIKVCLVNYESKGWR